MAPLAVKSSSFPVVVMTDVSDIEAKVGVMAPLPLIWNKEPDAAPAVELVMAPVVVMLRSPVVASMTAAPVGPVILIAPPVVSVVAPLTLMAWA